MGPLSLLGSRLLVPLHRRPSANLKGEGFNLQVHIRAGRMNKEDLMPNPQLVSSGRTR